MTTTAQDLAEQAETRTTPIAGPGERYAGYGVMGLPFASGHYLAFRRFPRTPFGLPYTSVWYRDPDGVWTFFVNAPAAESCPRYFDAAISASIRTEIALTWTGPSRVVLEIPGWMAWTVELERSAPTALMSGMARLMPGPAWNSRAVLAAMSRMAGPMLGAGRIRLTGSTPNGQWFMAGPRQVWSIATSTAVVDGTDLGRPGPLPEQTRLGDFWLPQTGLFMVGETGFEPFEPARHRTARPALVRAAR